MTWIAKCSTWSCTVPNALVSEKWEHAPGMTTVSSVPWGTCRQPAIIIDWLIDRLCVVN